MATVNTYLKKQDSSEHTLVVVFLRGGADGVNMIVPLEDDAYYRARPAIGVGKGDAIPLDGFFGMNAELGPLQAAYEDGGLAIIHQAGSEDTTRSHFEAQDWMEQGGRAAGGWLGRYLRASSSDGQSPLSAVALGSTKPICMLGAPSSIALESLETLRMPAEADSMMARLGALYEADTTELGSAGLDALKAYEKLQSLNVGNYSPAHGAEYPTTAFGRGLSQIAQLIKAGVGLEAATIDLGGWDSHLASVTLMNPLMRQLGSGLAAFQQDLGGLEDVTVVVMSEFGRRIAQNVSMGTDHGRGGVMFVLGGGVSGGRVVHDWQGLEPDKLEGPGDLPVVHNYRDVLAPILQRHRPEMNVESIFPDYQLNPVALYA